MSKHKEDFWRGIGPTARDALSARDYRAASLTQELSECGVDASELVAADRNESEIKGAWIPGVEIFARKIHTQRHRGVFGEFVRRDVLANPEHQPESESHLVASNINAVLQGATVTSVQEIDKVITELQTLRDKLNSEAERVQREIVQYSNLTQAALQSTKTITESLGQWRKAPDDGATNPRLMTQ